MVLDNGYIGLFIKCLREGEPEKRTNTNKFYNRTNTQNNEKVWFWKIKYAENNNLILLIMNIYFYDETNLTADYHNEYY